MASLQALAQVALSQVHARDNSLGTARGLLQSHFLKSTVYLSAPTRTTTDPLGSAAWATSIALLTERAKGRKVCRCRQCRTPGLAPWPAFAPACKRPSIVPHATSWPPTGSACGGGMSEVLCPMRLPRVGEVDARDVCCCERVRTHTHTRHESEWCRSGVSLLLGPVRALVCLWPARAMNASSISSRPSPKKLRKVPRDD